MIVFFGFQTLFGKLFAQNLVQDAALETVVDPEGQLAVIDAQTDFKTDIKNAENFVDALAAEDILATFGIKMGRIKGDVVIAGNFRQLSQDKIPIQSQMPRETGRQIIGAQMQESVFVLQFEFQLGSGRRGGGGNGHRWWQQFQPAWA